MYCNLAKLIQFKATPGKETLSKDHSAPQKPYPILCHVLYSLNMGVPSPPGPCLSCMSCGLCRCVCMGWHRGESARLPPTWPRFNSWTRCHMWVVFVVGSLLAPGGFSPGTPVFPSPQKTAFLNSGIKGPRVCQLQDCYMLPLSKSIYFFMCDT